MDQRNLISAMIFFLVASFVLLTSLGLGIGSLSDPRPGFMPLCAGLLLLIFSLVLFATAYADKSVSVRWSDIWHHTRWHKSAMACAALALYVLILSFFGFLIATCVLMTVLFKLGGMKIWTSALGAVLSVCCTYALFHVLLQTPLPRGIWGF